MATSIHDPIYMAIAMYLVGSVTHGRHGETLVAMSSALRSLSVEAEPGYVVEDGVGGEDRCPDVGCGRGDPEIVRMERFVQRMSSAPGTRGEARRPPSAGRH
jgi:hypothetical protein